MSRFKLTPEQAEEVERLKAARNLYDKNTGQRYDFYKVDSLKSLKGSPHGPIRIIVRPALKKSEQSRKQLRPIHIKKFGQLTTVKPK